MMSANKALPRLNLALTRALPPPVLDLFRERHNVWVNPHDRSLTAEELQQAASTAQAHHGHPRRAPRRSCMDWPNSPYNAICSSQ